MVTHMLIQITDLLDPSYPWAFRFFRPFHVHYHFLKIVLFISWMIAISLYGWSLNFTIFTDRIFEDSIINY